MRQLVATGLVIALVLTSGTAIATPIIDNTDDRVEVSTVTCATWGDFCAATVEYAGAIDAVYSVNGGVNELSVDGEVIGTLIICVHYQFFLKNGLHAH